MKPLHLDASLMRQPFQRVHRLLEDKDWTAAQAVLDELERSSAIAQGSPLYGEWSILKAQVALAVGEYRNAVRWGRESERAFQLTSEDRALAEAHRVLGLALLGCGETKNARIHTRDALAISRRLDDAQGMMRACNDLARIHFVRGEFDLAVDHLNDATGLARDCGLPERETAFLGNLGRIRLLQGQWSQAEEALRHALLRARADRNSVSLARNLLSLGYLFILRHDFTVAAGFLDESLVEIEKSNLPRERSIHCEYTGWWHFEQDHWIQSKEAFRSALAIGRRLSTLNDLVSQSLRGLAECEAALGDWPEALRLADEGLAVALEIDERAEIGCFYRLRALVCVHKGDPDQAAISLLRATEILGNLGDPYELARLALIRAEYLRFLDENDGEQCAALEEALAHFTRLGATHQALATQWNLVDALRRTGDLNQATQRADDLIRSKQTSSQGQFVISLLAEECVQHSLSAANEFRLGGMPWLAQESESPGDELQLAVDFYRDRIGASRVLLVEVTLEGKRAGRIIAQSGSSEEFANRLGAFAANAYQQALPTDRPQFYWSLVGAPKLAAHLTTQDGCAPLSVMTIPVELGPSASGMLYADVTPGDDSESRTAFEPRDLDFAVAFAEIVAWRSTKLRSEGLLRDVHRLRDQLGRASEFPSIITQDTCFRETLARVRMIVDADVSVLLEGETGTGKDLLGRAIHYSSKRRDRRFVSVNCAALPETLLESELFGVRRGAFTGADRDKAGLFEEADGGTFFLDEIGEMPLSVQTKLLRVLETKELVRLGDTKPIHVDVRVVSATNRNLTEEMERGTFRQDLYYRLAPLSFTLPPLRERREDIPLLLEHFLEETARETGRRIRLAPDAVRMMCAYHWPGNVRELANEIRKTVLLAEPDAIVNAERLSHKFAEEAASETASPDKPLPGHFSLYDHVAQIERLFIARALNQAGGVKKHAAARLGIPESTLRLKMKQYDITAM